MSHKCQIKFSAGFTAARNGVFTLLYNCRRDRNSGAHKKSLCYVSGAQALYRRPLIGAGDIFKR